MNLHRNCPYLERIPTNQKTVGINTTGHPRLFDDVKTIVSITATEPLIVLKIPSDNTHGYVDDTYKHLPRFWSIDGFKFISTYDPDGLASLGRYEQRFVERIFERLIE